MRAVDTNVIVGLLVRDNASQVAAAEAFVANGAWVSQLVLAEAIWVLASSYSMKADAIAAFVEMLLQKRDLILQDADVVALALAAFKQRPALGFSDCLVVEIARKAGHLPLGTFDRVLGRLDGAEKI